MRDYYDTELQALRAWKRIAPHEYEKAAVFVNHSICNAAINSMGRFAMGIDGISPYDRYKKIRNLMRKQEVQNAVAGINYKKENRDFAKKCRAIERQSAFKLMLDDGLALKLKRAIRACMKGHIK